jgi:toxin-antitoxin system PIN domain toxin
MRALFDVNALLALFDPGHTFHASARDWWEVNQEPGWATCPLTQNGFIRVMSQASYSGRRSILEAIDALQLGVVQPGHEFWPDSLSITDSAFIDPARILGPNQVTDIYLLGLAVKHGGRLVTFDRGIPLAAVRGARPENLVVVA